MRNLLTMKNVAALGCVAVLVGLACTAYGYSTAHDDLDVGALVNDVNALKSMLDCFTDKAPCSKMAQDFKSKMPEVILEACAKCSDIQRKKFQQFLGGLKEKLPVEFEEFKKKFDPEDKYFPALDAALAKD